MRKFALLAVLAALLLTACSAGTRYTRTAADGRIELTIQSLNGALDQTLACNSGDQIAIHVSNMTGDVRLRIALPDQEPIYEGRELPETFTVSVPETGEYARRVSGRGAGTLVFEVVQP